MTLHPVEPNALSMTDKTFSWILGETDGIRTRITTPLAITFLYRPEPGKESKKDI